jgi:hypothetical protein
MTNIGKMMLAFAILLTLISGIAILPDYVSAQPNITIGNATGGNMSETNNSTGFIPWLSPSFEILNKEEFNFFWVRNSKEKKANSEFELLWLEGWKPHRLKVLLLHQEIVVM